MAFLWHRFGCYLASLSWVLLGLLGVDVGRHPQMYSTAAVKAVCAQIVTLSVLKLQSFGQCFGLFDLFWVPRTTPEGSIAGLWTSKGTPRE